MFKSLIGRVGVSAAKTWVKGNNISAFVVSPPRMYASSSVAPSAADKEKAKKNVDAVTSVLGKQDGFYHEPEYDEKYIKKFVDFFNRPELDSWEIRRAMGDLYDYDCVPDPEIIIACLKACRRLNDFALAVRWMEMIQYKCGFHKDKFYPYILQEIRPTLDELGISLPEELGYNKPIMYTEDVDDMH